MPTKITIVIENPADPAEFENVYPDIADLAAQLPGLQRIESAKVWPKEDGTPTPAHRTLDLHFESYEAASAAVSTPPAGEFFQRLVGTGVPFIGLFSDIKRV